MFKDKLKAVMQELGINQAQLSQLTGIGKSSISGYVSGKVVPTEERINQIAELLGLDPACFREENSPITIVENERIPTFSPEYASKLMGLDATTIKNGLKEKDFPWGYAIHTAKDGWRYWINAVKFCQEERIPFRRENANG